MVGFSWFLPMSSIQVQAWPVHQSRPNRGVGLRRWIGRRINKRVEDLLIRVDRRLDVQAASPTAKMADSTCSGSPPPSRSSPASKPTADSHTASSIQPIAPHRRSQFHLLPIADSALASLGHSLSERWAGTIVWRDEGRRRTSRSTTVRTINSLLHLPTHM